VPAFAPRFRCLTYDQRGWGRSRCDGAPDPTAFGSDLAALLRHLGAEQATLVGQSMSGWAVLGCALAAPERVARLVLASTLAGLMDDGTVDLLVRVVGTSDPGASGALAALAPDYPAREPVRTFLFEQIAGL